ncbi:MAG: hypothetical protein KGK10_10525 [Rhodospirillales bacterium]|nr:hypothetical protein [Rhodospirillales bacterium]
MSASIVSPVDDFPGINPRNLVWVALALACLAAAIASPGLWALTFIHILCGLLWTGIDLFMGFVMGPILRQVSPPARRAVACRLMPKMLFLMPTLAAITGTAGWVLAGRVGFLALPWPQYAWVAAALVIVTILTLQGLGLLLPINLMVYFELRKPQPNVPRIARLMRFYVYGVGSQGLLQIAIIVIMARFGSGL